MTSPSFTVKPTPPWKRIAIISFFAGLGIALGVIALLGMALWYTSRPKPWDARAIRAEYKQSYCYVTFEEWYQKELKRTNGHGEKFVVGQTTPTGWVALLGKVTVQFSYDLKNTTNSDYTLQLPDSSGLVPMQRLKSNGTLVDGKGLKWSLSEPFGHLWTAEQRPILIPAHQTVRVVFSIDYDINGDDAAATSVTDWSQKDTQRSYARHLLKDADQFVLMDDARRYQIELPLQDALR